jgi:hypothetical protein
MGQHLTVKLNPCLQQSVNELAVAGVIQLSSSTDTGDPQAAKITLIGSSVPIGVAQRTINSFCRGAIQATSASPEPFSLL